MCRARAGSYGTVFQTSPEVSVPQVGLYKKPEAEPSRETCGYQNHPVKAGMARLMRLGFMGYFVGNISR
jgi:hypothetical protein